jgi:hypothetical protein
MTATPKLQLPVAGYWERGKVRHGDENYKTSNRTTRGRERWLEQVCKKPGGAGCGRNPGGLDASSRG